MNTYRTRRARRGFSMAEVLVAVVILSLALVAIMTHIVQGRKGANATLEELKGIGYAQDMIDRIKCTPYDKVPVMKDADDEANFGSNGLKIAAKEIRKVADEDKKNFTRLVTVEEFDEDMDGVKVTMKRIEVKVNWTVTNVDVNNRHVSRDVGVVLRTIIRKLVN